MMLFAQQIVTPPTGNADNWAIGAILALLILREVFGFLKGRRNGGDPMHEAVTLMAENLVEFRKTTTAERELLLTLQHGNTAIREDTQALRGLGHQTVGLQQQTLGQIKELRARDGREP